jgi:hypothetical protein
VNRSAPLYVLDLALAGDVTGPVASDPTVVGARDLPPTGAEALPGRDVSSRCVFNHDSRAG